MVVLPMMADKVAAIVAVPVPTAVTSPVLLTVATVALDDVQVTSKVMTEVVPSEYMPVAVKCLVAPTTRFESAGVTEMVVSVPNGVVDVPLLPLTYVNCRNL